MSVIKCSHCGKNLPDESKFCPYCMERINEPVPVKVPKEKKKLHKETIVMIIVTIVLFVLVLGIIVASNYKDTKDGTVLNNNSAVEGGNIVEQPEKNEDITEKHGSVSAGDDTQQEVGDETNASTEKDSSVSEGENGMQKNSGNNTDTAKEKNSSESVGGNLLQNNSGNKNSASPEKNSPDSGGVYVPGKTTTEKAVADNEEKTNAENSENETTASAGTNECNHSWVAITKTVHHDEAGHYENVSKDRPVTKYKCAVCYKVYDSISQYYNHFDNTHTPSYSGDPITIFREEYTKVTDYEEYTEKQWVIDKAAYDETVVTGYKCSICGKTK